jgi:hypothetical protein
MTDMRFDSMPQVSPRVDHAPHEKRAFEEQLRGATTPEAREALLSLLVDPDARTTAFDVAADAPWPALLEALTELAETDEPCARLAAFPIARCGAVCGPDERAAAADCLYELLDDDGTLISAAVALIHSGQRFPGLVQEARRLGKESGFRRVVGMSLLAAEHAGIEVHARLRASAELLRMRSEHEDEPTCFSIREMQAELEGALKPRT